MGLFWVGQQATQPCHEFVALVSQDNFCVGDITEQGFEKKIQKLEKEQVEQPSISATDAAIDLKAASKEVTLKAKLGKLFGKQQPSDSSSTFVSSALAVKSTQPKKKKKIIASSTRHITSVCLLAPTASVPRKKVREDLMKDGRIRDLKVSTSDSEMDDVEDEIKSIFGKFFPEGEIKRVTYYRANRSNCLAKADSPRTIEELFELVGHGSLYITVNEPIIESSVKSSIIPSGEEQLISPLIGQSVNEPSIESISSVESSSVSKEIIEEQLIDPLKGQLWLEQSGLIDSCQEDVDEV